LRFARYPPFVTRYRLLPTGSDLSVLKNQMTTLVGDGNSGRIGSIEQRVSQHEERFQSARGFAIAIGGLVTLIQFLLDFLRRK